MMKFKKWTPFLLVLFTGFPAACQGVRVGGKVPDILLDNVLNYPKDYIKLSQFRGKLVILSFWGTVCIGCLEEFPRLDSLQKQFGNRIQIIGVNAESKAYTRNFFERRKKFIHADFPLVTGDTVLSRLFPHAGDPFHVWIDSSGTIRYFLWGHNTTAAHIRQFLQGQKPVLSTYGGADTYINNLMDDRWEDSLLSYSYISHYIPGIHIGSGKLRPGTIQISANCVSALELYIQAFNAFDKYDFTRPGRLYLNLRDSFQYMRPRNMNLLDSWESRYAYDYQLLVPKSRKADRFKMMQQDLYRYFGLDARVIKKKVKCWVLIRTSAIDKLHTQGGRPKFYLRQSGVRGVVDTPVRGMTNEPYRLFFQCVRGMGEYLWKRPFVDGTGYNDSEHIDIRLKGSVVDSFKLGQLNDELARYDLKLVERYEPIDVLQIQDRNDG
jgi:thiol-disulfide isomerase/thioredoxin